jgi:hypothetical protein
LRQIPAVRASAILLGLTTLALGASLGVAACSSDEGVEGGGDGGVEAAPPRDATFDAREADPACDPRADLFAKVRDASIADGASTIGLCLGCTKAECAAEVAACTANCSCQGIVGKAAECWLTTQELGCVAALANIFVTPETRRQALQVLGCVQEQCPEACAVDGGATPADAGSTD